MRAAGSSKDFSVYDFGEDEQVVEAESRKYSKKASMLGDDAPPKCDKSSLTKHHFLEAFQGGSYLQSDAKNVFDVDTDDSNDSQKCDGYGAKDVNGSGNECVAQSDTSPVVEFFNSANDGRDHIFEGNFGVEATVHGLSRMESFGRKGFNFSIPATNEKEYGCSHLELESRKALVDVVSDEDQDSEPTSPSTSVSDVEVNEGDVQDQTSDSCSDNHYEMENEMNVEINLVPDYITLGDKCSAQSQIRFCSECIKIEVPDIYSGEYVHLNWTIDDLVHIRCQFNESAGIAQVMLILRQNAAVTENCENLAGLVKLEFAVSNPHWFEIEQKILMLATRYKAVWNVMSDDLMVLLEDVIGMNSIFSWRHSLYDNDEPPEDVVYPRGDPDAVTISKRDIKLLEPETFINDTIIDFYIKHLKDRIPLEKKQRLHFFNSFFFRKLADLDKNPESISEGKAAFLRVRKWTRKVNIFEKDYIFIPVNYNLHWSLLVICHPNELVHFRDDNMDKASKVPCILHMDSIKGSHRCLKNLVQSYISEEWKERFGELSLELSHIFANLRFVSLELPQQENSYDCGLFLLHYVELFLEEAPVNFNPFRITKFSNFLNKEWFPPAEASNKRFAIRKLMYEILADHSKIPSLNNYHHSQHRVDEEKASLGAIEVVNKLMVSASAVDGQCKKEDLCAQMVSSGCTSYDHIRLDHLEPSHLMSNFLMACNKEDGNANEIMQSDNIRFQLPDEICTTSKTIEIGTNQSQCMQDIPVEPMDIQDYDLGCKPSRSSEECVNGDFEHASRMEIYHPSTEERAKSTSPPRIHDSDTEIAAFSQNTHNSGEVAVSCSLEMEVNPGIEECPEDSFETAETAADNEETKESSICTQSNMPEASDEEIQPTEATRIRVADEDSIMAEAARATIACKCRKTEITITMADEEIRPTEATGITLADEDLTMAIQCKRRKTDTTITTENVEIQPTEATRMKIADEDPTMAEAARARRRKAVVLEEGRRLTRSCMKD